MHDSIGIENIEGLRRANGIEDVELGGQIRGLRVGGIVRLTFGTGADSFAGETLEVRITSIQGRAFRGKLVTGPVSPHLSELRAGAPITFTVAHIHSLAKR